MLFIYVSFFFFLCQTSEVEDYLEIIKQPMDMQTVS